MRSKKTMVAAMLLAGAGLAVMPATAAELVTNGDFSAGNTGFTSQYNYNVDAQQNPPGSYFIQTTGGDHTTGTGNYLNADSNYSSGSPYFWSETFAVVANSSYSFSAWVKSLNGGDSPTFAAQANNTDLFTPTVVSSGSWTQVTGTINSGAATSVTLRLFNRNGSYGYNDLGVDDVSFTGAAPAASGVPEPASWALMIGGVGLVGGVLRRRRVAPTRMARA